MTTIPKPDPRLDNVKAFGPTGYSGTFGKLLFIVTTDDHWADGREWLHVSVSRADGSMPSYRDLQTLKAMTIGDDRTAVEFYPRKDKHIDIAGPMGKEVRHLWACLSEDIAGSILPDFGRYGSI